MANHTSSQTGALTAKPMMLQQPLISGAKSVLRLVENNPIVHCHLRSVCISSHQRRQCWDFTAFESSGHLCLYGNHSRVTEAKNCKNDK